MGAHAVVAVLLRARLSLEVLVAAKDGLLALAEMTECYAEDKCKLQVRKLAIEFLKLLISQLFLVLNHTIYF